MQTKCTECNQNVIIQDDRQDTLLHASAVLACLQQLNMQDGLSDEAELGLNLILESVQQAIRLEAKR